MPTGRSCARPRAAVHAVLGRDAAIVCSPGTYDQKHIDRIGQLRDCIAYGPGILELAHQPDEYVEIDDLVAAAKVMALAAYALLTDWQLRRREGEASGRRAAGYRWSSCTRSVSQSPPRGRRPNRPPSNDHQAQPGQIVLARIYSEGLCSQDAASDAVGGKDGTGSMR